MEPADPGSGEVDADPSTVARASRALGLLVLLTLFVLLVRVATQPITNPDTYFHLRFGHEFLHGWSIWDPGTVSTLATRQWVPTQWLSEIVMAQTEAWFGIAGVHWLAGLVYLAYVLTLFLACRRRAPLGAAVGITLLALFASTDGLSARPQVVSYVFMVLVVDAWLRTRDDGRPRWWLVPLTWVWAMLHGMWLLGIVVSVAATVGLVLDSRETAVVSPRDLGGTAVVPPRDRGRTTPRLLLLPLAMAIAAAMTPLGPKLYPAVALVGSRSHFFDEWAPPDFGRPAPLVLGVLLAVLVVRLRLAPATWFHVLLILAAGGLAVYSNRTVPLAAALAAPLAAEALGMLLPGRDRGSTSDLWLARGGFAAALVLLAVLAWRTTDADPYHLGPVDRRLRALPAGTRFLALDTTSGYLMWRYPQLDLVAHGYGDAYTDAEIRANRGLFLVQPGWDTFLARIRVRQALLPPTSALADALVRQYGWRQAASTDRYVYLIAPGDWPAGVADTG